MSNSIQLRDSSDITTFKKNRAIYQNYIQRQAKGVLPIGGIPHEDLMAVGRIGAQYIPTDSLATVVTAQADCPSCTNTVTYATTEIAAKACRCNASVPYDKRQYSAVFRN